MRDTSPNNDSIPLPSSSSLSSPLPADKTENYDKILKVQKEVAKAGKDLRARYPILRHQDAIGVAILAASLAGMVTCAAAYYYGHLPLWVTFPLITIFTSLLHELEHDLIHNAYFKKSPWVQHIMMLLIWVGRPNTVSPWTRRAIHHHHYSGTEFDLEERAIGNGMPWGFSRILVTLDPILFTLLHPMRMLDMLSNYATSRSNSGRGGAGAGGKATVWRAVTPLFGYFPLSLLHYVLWHAFCGYHFVDKVLHAPAIRPFWEQLVASAGAGLFAVAGAFVSPAPTSDTGSPSFAFAAMSAVGNTVSENIELLNFLAAVLLGPNFFRLVCLQFISGSMHYYGDIDHRDIIKQTMVLNPWWLLPIQIFCFNFGSTHAIHHFFMKEPFYIRQMTAGRAHAVMREVGVRFNDFGSFKRSNRYNG